MDNDYFKILAFSKGSELERVYLQDVGTEKPAIDIITQIFNDVASSRLDVSWLCRSYINKEFSLKVGTGFSEDRKKIKKSLSILTTMRRARKVRITNILAIDGIKELYKTITPLSSKNMEMNFDVVVSNETKHVVLYEVMSADGYAKITGTKVGYAVLRTPYNSRVFLLKKKGINTIYGINCLELKIVIIDKKREVSSGFGFMFNGIITPTELEQLIPDNLLGPNNILYMLCKYRHSKIQFKDNDRIEKFLNNIYRVYGEINDETLNDSILRTDACYQGYEFFNNLLRYMVDNDIVYNWTKFALMIKTAKHNMTPQEYSNLEKDYGF